MLAIAQALLCGPKLLIVDELSLGLAPLLVKELMARLVELRAKFNLQVGCRGGEHQDFRVCGRSMSPSMNCKVTSEPMRGV